MKTIIQKEKKCFICGSYRELESHHVFGGPNRANSEKYGLKVWLCHTCHNEPPVGVHFNHFVAEYLHRIGQMAFNEAYEEDFEIIFGRNYL